MNRIRRTRKADAEECKHLPGERLIRLMNTVVIMQSGEAVNIPSLCAQFNVCRRTVFRDIELIRKVGLPIVLDPHRRGYAFLRRQSLRCPQLKVDELFLLIVAVRSLSAASNQHVASILRIAISKILASSIHELSVEAIEIADHVAKESKSSSTQAMIEKGLAEIKARRL